MCSAPAAGFKAKRLSAQTGHDAPDDCVTRTWDTSINCQYDPSTIKKGRVSLTPGERGCAMSHAVLWARCAAQGDAGAPLLVVEDDVQFRQGAGEAVAELVKHLEKTNPVPSQRLMMLYLTGDVAAWRDKKSQSVDGEYDVKLREAEYIWQTACYVIWPAAARRLLQSLPVDGPVDNFISKHALHKRVCALVTQPNLAWQAAPYEEGDIAHSGANAPRRPRPRPRTPLRPRLPSPLPHGTPPPHAPAARARRPTPPAVRNRRPHVEEEGLRRHVEGWGERRFAAARGGGRRLGARLAGHPLDAPPCRGAGHRAQAGGASA